MLGEQECIVVDYYTSDKRIICVTQPVRKDNPMYQNNRDVRYVIHWAFRESCCAIITPHVCIISATLRVLVTVSGAPTAASCGDRRGCKFTYQ